MGFTTVTRCSFSYTDETGAQGCSNTDEIKTCCGIVIPSKIKFLCGVQWVRGAAPADSSLIDLECAKADSKPVTRTWSEGR